MKWVKPKFEIVELCSEVTSYLLSPVGPRSMAGPRALAWGRVSLPRHVRVRVLGSAAGGGYPQWNCHCMTCEAARAGVRARPRTQSSLAIRGDDGPWFLVNASPDARQQIETLTPERSDGVRATPVAGVLLTDAEIDHTAGLLLLRESATPLRVFGDAGVERALRRWVSRAARCWSATAASSGRRWNEGGPIRSKGPASRSSRSRRAATRRATSSEPDVELQASGFVFRDRASGGVVTYVPGLASLDDAVVARFAASDLVLVDGTFWRDDELARLGISDRSGATWDTCRSRAPAGRSRRSPALERPRMALVHINNTNPILLEDSPEREEVVRAGDRSRLRWPRGRSVTDEFVARLRAQGTRYHDLHPFHRRMDAGELTREELQRWVANRFYYQRCIPLKDAAILANCPDVEVRREWVRRIIDHDGTAAGEGGIESWLRLGEALGVPRERAGVGAAGAARGALRGRRLRELRAPQAVGRGRRVIAHRAVRAGRDPRAARGARASLRVDRPAQGSSTSARGSCRRRATRSTRSTSRSSAAGRASSRTPPSRRCASRPRCCGCSSTPSSAATRNRPGRTHDPSPPGDRRAPAVRRGARGARPAGPRGRRAPQSHRGGGARAVRRRALARRHRRRRSPRATTAPISAPTFKS